MLNTLDVGIDIKGELISEHYIKNRLKKSKEFEEMSQEAEVAFANIKEIYEGVQDVIHDYEESDLEEEFIKPVLSELGFGKECRHVQPPFLSHKGVEERPDFALFNDEEDKKEAIKNRDVSDDYFDLVIGLIESKKVDKDLDKGRKRNPAVQIKRYLRMTKVRWGILTNGKKWRLYCEDTGYSSNVYLEFDLFSILEHNKKMVFNYFYTFFSHASFKKEKGSSFLDEIFEENVKFAREVEDELEKNVYEALKVLAEGFLHYGQNDLGKEDLAEIHESSLILLYRKLFLFYAESKGLIEFGKHYKKYSMLDVREDVKEDIESNQTYAPLDYSYWTRIKRTFEIINSGSEKVIGEDGIPPYNGGLFDPEKHEFLEENSIGNNHLMDAIDLLARRKGKEGWDWVDYETLQIRHLGSIYEKLLEYKLDIASEDLTVDDDGEYVTAEEDDEIFVEKDEVYLKTDKGERKATGSYYTPDYIVQYIVENTVGELIDEKTDNAEENGESEAKAILEMKVLDPAMGSGHFLVGAVEYMAEELVSAVNRDIENGVWDEEEMDLDEAKREVVSHCIYGVDVNPLAVELAKLSLWLTTLSEGKPLDFLDHRLKCGNSLIGADLLEVPWYPPELLSGKEKEQAEEMREKRQSGKQKTFKIPFIEAVGELVSKIKKQSSETIKDVKHKKEIFEELKQSEGYKRLKTLCDLYTGMFFGEKPRENEREKWGNYVDSFFDPNKKKWIDKPKYGWPKRNLQIAEKKNYFHWKLEYPEIFFEKGELKNSPGFDVVIGNPPYVGEKDMKDVFRELKAASHVKECYKGRMDMLYFFVLLGTKLTNDNGLSSMITTSYWPETDSASNLRKELLADNYLKELIHFNGYKVFKQAKGQENIITIFGKEKSTVEISYLKNSNIVEEDVKKSLLGDKDKFWTNEVDYDELDLPEDGSEWIGFKSLAQSSVEINSEKIIGDFFYSKQGIVPNPDKVTGRNIDSFSDEVSKGEGIFLLKNKDLERIGISSNHDLLEKAYRNSDIYKYSIDYTKNLYLIYITSKTDIQSYPKIKKHLKRYKPKLESRREVQNGKIEWYSLHWPRERKIFENPKIVYSNWGNEWQPYAIEDNNFYERRDITILAPKDDLNLKFYTAILNSKISKYWQEVVSSRTGYTTQSGTEGIPVPDEKDNKLNKLVISVENSRDDFFKEKNQFLEWVTAEWGVNIEHLSLKTHLRKYWKYDFDEFMRIAKKNKADIDGNVKSRKFRELMKEEWKNSIETLNLLIQKINKLENKIDSIVFDLYDLTEHEVEVVLDSLDTDEEDKEDILDKFRNIK